MIAGADPGVPDDRPRDVRIEEEILAERLARSDPMPVRQVTELRGPETRGLTS